MITALILHLLLAFNDGFGCEVRGDLYTMTGEPAELTRTDGCQVLIHHAIQDGALHLWSDSHWVLIVLPRNGGHQRLFYKWGSVLVHVEGTEFQVAHGPTVGG